MRLEAAAQTRPALVAMLLVAVPARLPSITTPSQEQRVGMIWPREIAKTRVSTMGVPSVSMWVAATQAQTQMSQAPIVQEGIPKHLLWVVNSRLGLRVRMKLPRLNQ